MNSVMRTQMDLALNTESTANRWTTPRSYCILSLSLHHAQLFPHNQTHLSRICPLLSHCFHACRDMQRLLDKAEYEERCVSQPCWVLFVLTRLSQFVVGVLISPYSTTLISIPHHHRHHICPLIVVFETALWTLNRRPKRRQCDASLLRRSHAPLKSSCDWEVLRPRSTMHPCIHVHTHDTLHSAHISDNNVALFLN